MVKSGMSRVVEMKTADPYLGVMPLTEEARNILCFVAGLNGVSVNFWPVFDPPLTSKEGRVAARRRIKAIQQAITEPSSWLHSWLETQCNERGYLDSISGRNTQAQSHAVPDFELARDTRTALFRYIEEASYAERSIAEIRGDVLRAKESLLRFVSGPDDLLHWDDDSPAWENSDLAKVLEGVSRDVWIKIYDRVMQLQSPAPASQVQAAIDSELELVSSLGHGRRNTRFARERLIKRLGEAYWYWQQRWNPELARLYPTKKAFQRAVRYSRRMELGYYRNLFVRKILSAFGLIWDNCFQRDIASGFDCPDQVERVLGRDFRPVTTGVGVHPLVHPRILQKPAQSRNRENRKIPRNYK